MIVNKENDKKLNKKKLNGYKTEYGPTIRAKYNKMRREKKLKLFKH